MSFLRLLEDEMAKHRDSVLSNNTDFDRFGSKDVYAEGVELSAFNEKALCRLYDLLEDPYSKDVLVRIIAFRILGNRRYRLPLNTDNYWQDRENIRSLGEVDNYIPIKFMDWKLHYFDMREKGIPIGLYSMPIGIHNSFILKQYEYSQGVVSIKAEEGDVVLDAGGCWGDTALCFANEVGDLGKICTFEFVPSNLEILERNLGLNQELADRVEVVKRPLWKNSSDVLYFSDNGPSTLVTDVMKEGYSSVQTYSIDDFVEDRGLDRVNFIKMDIEGSELNALEGTVKTLARFRPKLTISIYHKLNDFELIPDFLLKLDLGYKFYLNHCTTYAEETVLFAEI